MGKWNQKQVLTCGDGDNGVGDLLAEISLSSLLHLGQNHGTNLLRALQFL